MNEKLKKWLEKGEHLPEFLRDFHEQKKVFKTIHSLYQDDETAKVMPNWCIGHQYVIDWFLWYMASRGYTLQKSRKNIEFKDLEK